MNDIYFDKNYGKLYENIEHGKACIFECSTENGTIVNQFIKREIHITIDNQTYYDIVTPYGYGGPYIKKCVNREKLLNDYLRLFEKYCKKNNIVAEFIRFHPIYKNYLDFKGIYNCSFNRYTLATNISKYDNPVESEFSKHCRRTIKQVLKEGITFKMIEKPSKNDMKEFQRIYYLNMQRKEAKDYYYFDNKYFQNIMKFYLNKIVIAEAIFDSKIVAAGLYFISDKNIHAHLSGTDTKYLYLSPAYILKYGTALWAKEHNYNFIHYGGGITSSEEDSLFQFKSKFAKNTKLEFWIGKKIWNKKIYNALCNSVKVSIDEEFFPAYRKEKQ